MDKEITSELHALRSRAGSGLLIRLIRARARNGVRSVHFWVILVLLVALTYIYYTILPGFYDLYILLFFYPLAYAAIIYRLRGAIITSLALLAILLPQAAVRPGAISFSLLLLFGLFIFHLNLLGATLLNYLEAQIQASEEILTLNEKLNDYIQQLETTQRQLVQSGKMSAIGELAASIAHEVNNPLAGVLIYVKLIAKKLAAGTLETGEALANLRKMEAALDHCSRIIKGLLDFSRQSEPVLKPVAVASIIDQALMLVNHQAEMKHIKIAREDGADVPPVLADAGQVQQVFINLAVNAIQAMEEGGRLTVATQARNGLVGVAFRDTGSGISPENMKRLFTPFFTTKEAGKGVGLGLAVSHGIIERHGGRIEVASEVGKGSTFTVWLRESKEGEAKKTTPTT